MNKQILIKLRNNFLAPGGLLEILPWADYILMKILSLLKKILNQTTRRKKLF
jgi:hypothetical protein